MERTERAELTVLCLICDEDRILLQNRVKRDWQGYTLPGGHVEPGESFTQAVIREMKEETGLDIRHPVLCGVKQFPIEGGRYIVLLYKASQFSGTLCSSEEGEMRWISRSELPKLALVDDFAKLLKVMEDETLSEFQYVIEGGKWEVKQF